jgi:hypothetical protein
VTTYLDFDRTQCPKEDLLKSTPYEDTKKRRKVAQNLFSTDSSSTSYPLIVSPSCLDPFDRVTHDSTSGRPVHLHSSRVEILSLIVNMRDESSGETGGDDTIGEQLGA